MTHWKFIKAGLTVMVLCLSSLLVVPSAWAAETMSVAMTDGSTLQAEVISMKDGVYTLRSSSMGTFQVQASNVRSLSRIGRNDPKSSALPPSPLAHTDMKALQTQATNTIMNNPKLMEKLFALKDDPSILRIMNNPKLMAAIQAGDISQLQNNPELMQLMNNPMIRELVKSSQP